MINLNFVGRISKKHLTKTLIYTWIIILVLGEWGLFYLACLRCIKNSTKGQIKVAIVADPQLTDKYSYKQSEGLLLTLTQFYSDIFMKRAYKALVSTIKPEQLIFLGDLFDGGREWDDSEFDKELQRFSWIFKSKEGLKFHYMAGNHDIGFGERVITSARNRFEKTFNRLNFNISVGGHFIVMLDTVSISAVSYKGSDAFNYMKEVYATKPSCPLILFTHVPLWRPDDGGCLDSFRRSKSIKQGFGHQYQNLVDKDLSTTILETLRPVLVFSGDDHDQCHYRHILSDGSRVSEYTVGTFSWLQGNHYPSFGLLLLKPKGIDDKTVRHEFNVCFLPKQLDIYVFYAIFAFLSIIHVGLVAFGFYDRLMNGPSIPSSRSKKNDDETSITLLGSSSDQSYFIFTVFRVLICGLTIYVSMLIIEILT